jgi:selT/selW/selH-like putative selenoprotein
LDQAVSLAVEILTRWAPIMRTVDLQSGDHGRFEVTLDGKLVFSKAAAHRFPKPGEMTRIIETTLGPPLQWRESKT